MSKKKKLSKQPAKHTENDPGNTGMAGSRPVSSDIPPASVPTIEQPMDASALSGSQPDAGFAVDAANAPLNVEAGQAAIETPAVHNKPVESAQTAKPVAANDNDHNQKTEPVSQKASPATTVGTREIDGETVSSGGSHRPRFSQIVFSVLTLAVVAALGFMLLKNSRDDPSLENSSLIAAVTRTAVVPAGETPAVSTVVDESKLNQEFLRGARTGDKVLLYFQAGKAVVYRPSTSQVVNMGPLESPKPRVMVRAGSARSDTTGMARQVASSTEFLLASQDSSSKKDYAKTVVIDVTGSRPDIAERLSRLLGASVASLPAGETKPDADMLVIVGNDYRAPGQ